MFLSGVCRHCGSFVKGVFEYPLMDDQRRIGMVSRRIHARYRVRKNVKRKRRIVRTSECGFEEVMTFFLFVISRGTVVDAVFGMSFPTRSIPLVREPDTVTVRRQIMAIVKARLVSRRSGCTTLSSRIWSAHVKAQGLAVIRPSQEPRQKL